MFILSREKPHGVGIWYVAQQPGLGGKDWGYTTNPTDATPLSDYWRRRFLADMRYVGAHAIVREVVRAA